MANRKKTPSKSRKAAAKKAAKKPTRTSAKKARGSAAKKQNARDPKKTAPKKTSRKTAKKAAPKKGAKKAAPKKAAPKKAAPKKGNRKPAKRAPRKAAATNAAAGPRPKKVKRVCILTGGGDAPGLNAVLRGFVKHAHELDIDVFGAEDGFTGLIEPGGFRRLRPMDVRGILPRGGSVLGCSNRANPFSYPVGEKGEEELVDVSDRVVRRLKDNDIDILVLVGGDGTMAMGMRFQEMGIPVVGIPKTIDNDLAATDFTFGLDTAVTTATWAIDALHTTAEAHDRVMILELMGRYAGWISLSAGIAGGADVILIPEIPYDVERVAKKIRQRSELGATFSIVVVGEGARPKEGTVSTISEGREGHLPRLGGAGHRLAAELDGMVPHEIRTTVLGHIQRGGSPSSFDRLLGTRFGVAAAELCKERRTGRLVSLRGTSIVSAPLEEATAEPKLVAPDGQLVKAARAVGIELGG